MFTQSLAFLSEQWRALHPALRSTALSATKIPVVWVAQEAISTLILGGLAEGPAYHELGGRNFDPITGQKLPRGKENPNGRHLWSNKLRPHHYSSYLFVAGFGTLCFAFRKFAMGESLKRASVATLFQIGVKVMDVFVYTRAWGTDSEGLPQTKNLGDSQCCPGGKLAGLQWITLRVMDMTFRAAEASTDEFANIPIFSFLCSLD